MRLQEAPEQLPDHPVKRYPVAGVAVRDTPEPYVNVKEQVEPQLMPAGEEVTLPDPVLETVRVRTPVNVAVTDFT